MGRTSNVSAPTRAISASRASFYFGGKYLAITICMQLGDFNADGKLDIAFALYYANSVGVMLNTTM
jgi:hypothetical protein